MGFETKIFKSTIKEDLICNICKLVLEDPIICQQCQFRCCIKCFLLQSQQEEQDSTKCLNQACNSTNFQAEVNKEVLEQVLQLEVFCENQGCQEVVHLKNLKTHIDQICTKSQDIYKNLQNECEKGFKQSSTLSTEEKLQLLQSQHQFVLKELQKQNKINQELSQILFQLIKKDKETVIPLKNESQFFPEHQCIQCKSLFLNIETFFKCEKCKKDQLCEKCSYEEHQTRCQDCYDICYICNQKKIKQLNCKTCSQSICSNCCLKDRKQNVVFCLNCLNSCSLCNQKKLELQVCDKCNCQVCTKCSEMVDSKFICQKCYQTCQICQKQSANIKECSTCQKVCCQNHYGLCIECSRAECQQHIHRCYKCKKKICLQHENTDHVCKVPLCPGCSQFGQKSKQCCVCQQNTCFKCIGEFCSVCYQITCNLCFKRVQYTAYCISCYRKEKNIKETTKEEEAKTEETKEAQEKL